jgi:hypothetical protein
MTVEQYTRNDRKIETAGGTRRRDAVDGVRESLALGAGHDVRQHGDRDPLHEACIEGTDYLATTEDRTLGSNPLGRTPSRRSLKLAIR